MKISLLVRKLLPKSIFARSVSILVGGTAMGQVITILASPLLTRLYTPGDFGTLAVFSSFLSIAAVVASLRYELAIPLPEDDKTAAHVSDLSLFIVFSNSLLAGILVCFFGSKLVHIVNVLQLRSYLWLLPIGILGVGTYQVFSYWAIRKKAFKRVAQTKVNQSITRVATQVGLGIALNGPLGLILGQIVGQAAGSATLATLAWRNDNKVLKSINKKGLLLVAKRYKRFPLFSSWAAIFNALSWQLPVVLLSSFFGPTVTGFYSLGERILQTPMSLIGQSIAQVFFSSAADANRSGNLSIITMTVFQKLVQVGLPVIMLIGIAAPELFAFIFGSEWQQAGIYAQWLAPWLFLVFISSPLSMLPSILEKQQFDTFFQVISLLSMTIPLAVGASLGDERMSIALFALVSALCRFGIVLWYMNLSNNKIKHTLLIMLSETVAVLPLLLPIILVKIFAEHNAYVLWATVLSSVLVSCRLVRLLRFDWRR